MPIEREGENDSCVAYILAMPEVSINKQLGYFKNSEHFVAGEYNVAI